MITKIKLILIIAILLILIIFSPDTSKAEVRAILDEDFYWLTPESADKLLSRIKKAGFNVLIPCVWHGSGTTWPSSLAPKDLRWESLYNKNPILFKDPLAYLIKKAHEMEIEVHPWFTVTLRQREFFPEFYDEGTPEKFFNVHIPAFRKFIVDLMLEVVKKYDVDGINLDYIRSGGICSSQYCVDDYKSKYGRNLKWDILNRQFSKEALQTIIDWNSKAVEEIVENTSKEIKKLKPNIILSVDSVAGYQPLLVHGTDSVSWANKGWIDIVFHMNYNYPIDPIELKKIIGLFSDPNKFILLIGNYDKLSSTNIVSRDPQKLVELISLAQNINPLQRSGVYLYNLLSDEQIEKLRIARMAYKTKLLTALYTPYINSKIKFFIDNHSNRIIDDNII